MNICPCCKQPVPGKDLLVSLDTNSVSHNGKIVRLEPQSVALLEILRRRYPACAPNDTIIEGMYGNWVDIKANDPMQVIKVRISNMRRLLASLGVEIKNEYGRGYRLHVT